MAGCSAIAGLTVFFSADLMGFSSPISLGLLIDSPESDSDSMSSYLGSPLADMVEAGHGR